MFSTPCTGICIWQNSAVAAYGCGHIRLFDITSGNVLAEITAHAKWISALHIAQSSGLVSIQL